MSQHDEAVEPRVPGTSAELLALVEASRAKLDAIVGAIPDDLLLRPHSRGGWAVHGHLTHLAAWNRMLVAHLTEGNDHEVAGMTPQEYERASLEELNTRIHDIHKDDAVAQVRAEYAAAYRAIAECIARLSPEDLARPYWPDDDRTVASKIAGDTYLHYDEHREWILEIVDAPS